MLALQFIAALMAASALATPIALERSVEAIEADLAKRWEDRNPLAKRTVNPKTVNGALTADQITAQRNALFMAQSETHREAIIFPNAPDATNATFQFINNTVRAPTGGTIFLSTVNNFPYLGTTNLAQAVGFVNPCGLNIPHWHPRANEFLTVIQGELLSSLVLENDTGFGNVVGGMPQNNGPLPLINSVLSNFTGQLFPKGLVHWQFNQQCEPAIFVAGFDSNDPGRAEAALGFFSGSANETLDASMGYSEFLTPSQVAGLRPTLTGGFTAIVSSCAKRCGIPFQ